MVAVVLWGVVFWMLVPFFIVTASLLIDPQLHLPKFFSGWSNRILGWVLTMTGWLFGYWTAKVQFSSGKGSPIPLMATQKLVVKRPYTYCRNPMTLGTTAFYFGIALWTGSLSALSLSIIYPVAMLLYIKLIEEKELEQRFGVEYLEYKRRTPFLLPRFRN